MKQYLERRSRHKESASSGNKPNETRVADCGDRTSSCCDVGIRVDCDGDVNIYNCCAPSETGKTPLRPCTPCFPPYGACLPVVPGAKHKLSRDQKLKRLVEGVSVPSALAAGAMHMIRRFVLGKTPENQLEAAVFATLGRTSRDLLSCTLAAFDAAPPEQRNRLFAQSLLLDPNQPLNEAALSTALGQELVQRIGVQVFGDPNGLDEERPGRMRVYEPQGEDFFSQVRICKVNDLRTANFIPPINIDDRPPNEIQHDCQIKIVDGQPQVSCQVRATNCQGNSFGNVCARVPDIAQGDGVVLQGVNYFSVDANVRFIDKQSGTAVRDVDAHVWGDVDTPVTEVINNQTVLINDCRVQDRLTFSVPDDLAPGIYQINVVVPNITGISAFGNELVSNSEFINVIPSATARFEIGTEWIYCRKETSPEWLGSDEVGLHTLSAAFDANYQLVDLPDLANPNERTNAQKQPFKEIQNVDFDSGTPRRDITRKVFAPDKPILGMLLVALGDEIDSQHAYDNEVTGTWDNFLYIIERELPYIGSALGADGVDLIKSFSWKKVIATAIALAILAGIDLLVAWWAPADPIIRDAIGLSITDLAALTNSSTPPPDPATFTTESGITVNVNKTIPPQKLPTQYKETREYVSDDQDSRYEITYDFNRVA